MDGRKGRLLTVVLQQAAIGSYEFRLVYEKRLSAVAGKEREWATALHAPEPLGENASSYAFALNLSSGEVLFGKPTGLSDADPLTFPQLPDKKVLPRHLILRGWRGRTGGWSLPVTLRIHSFADFPDALISSADMLCTVGRDGWTRNRMTYTVLNRTRQFLELTMPKGADLEAVRVGGRAVKPGRRRVGGSERILIPLTRMQVGDVSTQVEIYWSRPLGNPDRPMDLSRIGNLEILEPEVFGLEVEQTFFTVNLPEGYGFSFDGNMQEIGGAARTLWQLEKALEEQERVVQVQSKGNQAQQARADESGLSNRLNIESLTKKLQEGRLTRQEEERRQVLLMKTGAVDENFAENFRDRAGQSLSSSKNRLVTLKQEDLAKAAKESKKLAKDRVQQEYRYKGKRNVVSQKWAANEMLGPQTNAAIGKGGGESTIAGDEELRAQWRTAFAEVAQAAIPQSGGFSWPGSGVVSGQYQFGGGGGGAGHREKNYRGPAGDIPPGQRDPMDPVPPPEMPGGSPTTMDPRRPAEKRAGLLSLPVTVPTRGQTFRFEKLNGGARLEVSASRATTTGSGLGELGIFALILAALAAFYRFRPDRKIPYFRPGLLFLVALVLTVNSYAFPLLPVLAMLVAVNWAVIEWRHRRRQRVAL